MKRLIVALVVFELLVLGDVATTIFVGLPLGASDLNPLYYAQGFRNFLIVKLGFSFVALPLYIGVYRYLKNKFPNYTKVIWTLLLFLIGLYLIIVGNNIQVILRQLSALA